MFDPTVPLSAPFASSPDKQVSLQTILENQLTIASDLQDMLRRQGSSMSPRDQKELVTATSNLISLAHRTDQTLKTIQTYKVFVDVVLEFLKQRSDQLGEDLLAELRAVARGLRAEQEIEEVTSH